MGRVLDSQFWVAPQWMHHMTVALLRNHFPGQETLKKKREHRKNRPIERQNEQRDKNARGEALHGRASIPLRGAMADTGPMLRPTHLWKGVCPRD